MRLAALSDVHGNLFNPNKFDLECDLLIIAGDICPTKEYVNCSHFPANWLELATRDDLTRYGITVQTMPDPVRPPLTLETVKRHAKSEAERRATRASVIAVITQAEADIDDATTEAEVQAVLDAI